MVVQVERSGTIDTLNKALQEISKIPDVKGLMILVCDQNNLKKEDLDPVLQRQKLPLFGGAYPFVIYGKEVLEKGSIVIGLFNPPDVQYIQGLNSQAEHFDAVLKEKYPDPLSSRTMFVIVDGTTNRVKTFLESLYKRFGLDINYIGGGAGSMGPGSKPCVFSNEGLMEDCAVLATLEAVSGVGAAHGMQSFSGPYRITEAEKNTIKTIEWEPAYQLYSSIIEKHPEFNEENKNDNFFGVDPHFSLGLNRLHEEKIVLEPMCYEADNSLIVLPEIKQGDFIDIMYVTREDTVNAAIKAKQIARQGLESSFYDLIFCFSCSARYMFLGEEYTRELEAIYEENVPQVGVLTIGGEIANCRRHFIEYYNRTCVIGLYKEA